eukprot:7380679-Prymnesium_polylepis.1
MAVIAAATALGGTRAGGPLAPLAPPCAFAAPTIDALASGAGLSTAQVPPRGAARALRVASARRFVHETTRREPFTLLAL